MFTLIKNEFFKMFHKKSIYIFTIVAILFSLLVTFVYKEMAKVDFNDPSWGYTEYESKDYYKEIMATSEKNSYEYTDALASLETVELLEKYDEKDWRHNIIQKNYASIAREYYQSKNNDYFYHEQGVDYEKKYNDFRSSLENSDWRYFVNLELEDLKRQIASIEEYKKENSKMKEDELDSNNEQIFILSENVRMLEYRLKENVCYGDDYLNRAINTITSSSYTMYEYNKLDASKKAKYDDLYTVTEYHKAQYILDNKLDTTKETQLRNIFMEFFSEYGFLILVFIVMIAGTIVSEEYHKGTIKSLLTIPRTRTKILLSKFIASILMIPFFIGVLLLIQTLLGVIILGTESLGNPVLVYNFDTLSIESVSIVKYCLLQFITRLPEYILLMTLAFTLSTLFTNSAVAIAVTLCGSFGSSIINALAQATNQKIIMNYFVTSNWNLSYYLFGGQSPYGTSMIHALIVCLVYFVIMIGLSFIVFKKRDVKNI